MTTLDWLVLCATLAFIVVYGAWSTRRAASAEAYFRGEPTQWPTIGLSVMATQASAITFLSTPGQAYEDGMRFVQFYFGLPLAMIVISAVFLPIYHRLRVVTAYEYLEHRFDARVRYLGASLFLVQRGLSAGITIYAPAIILSTILGWSLGTTTFSLGALVIVYTVLGGAEAVSRTQKQQMVIMLAGMVLAAGLILWRLPPDVTLPRALKLAGALDRMNPVSFELNFNNRYNFWSGITGGFFLALSYFGTDQSQVGRYLSGRSLTESRLGLLFNAVLKIPMQFVILGSGVLLFVFYLFTMPPVFFNTAALEAARKTPLAGEVQALEARYAAAFERQREAAERYVTVLDTQSGDGASEKQALRTARGAVEALRKEAKQLVVRAVPSAETKDADYVFIGFVLRYVPAGFVGLLIAVIFCASMSSTASELTALGSTSTLDLYRRMRRSKTSPEHDLLVSKALTALWGVLAVSFAGFASLLDNLIEAVNIVGSLFYGTVLGIFLVAFFFKRVRATPVLVGAVCAQATVLTLFFTSELGFLWYNVVGSAIVVLIALLLQRLVGSPKTGTTA